MFVLVTILFLSVFLWMVTFLAVFLLHMRHDAERDRRHRSRYSPRDN